MAKWRCLACGYVYDEAAGEPSTGAKAGTKFENLPKDWNCPVCGAEKSAFEKVKE